MNVLVLVKCVPNTETRVRVAADGKSLDDTDVKWVLNPYDEFAVEEGLRQVEKAGTGQVTVVSLGDGSVAAAELRTLLRKCLALGAERAVLLDAPEFHGGDGLSTAVALAAACRKLGFDLILAGKQGVGTDRNQVPVMLAELLDLAHVAVVSKLAIDDASATCEREIEGGREVVEATLPCVITAQKGLNEPRHAKLQGIMKAKKKPLDVWGPADLDVAAETVGAAGAGATWSKLELPPPRPKGRLLEGDPGEAAAELVRLLSEEAKVI